MKYLILVLTLIGFVSCATLEPAPQMAFKHNKKFYCASYVPGMQTDENEEPIILIGETTELGCPLVEAEGIK